MDFPVRAVFLASFDNIVGPKLDFQSPAGSISVESFDAISEYVITQPSLCGKIITVLHPTLCSEEALPRQDGKEGSSSSTANPAMVMSCPIGLSHERYHRNQLLCAIGLVLEPSEDLRAFEAVLLKLAGYLLSMEVERGIFSQPSEKARLQAILPAILHGLNTRGECFVRVGAGAGKGHSSKSR